jgi:hypothetical protein
MPQNTTKVTPEHKAWNHPWHWLAESGQHDFTLEDKPEDTWYDVPCDCLPCPDGWDDLRQMFPRLEFTYECPLGKCLVRPKDDMDLANDCYEVVEALQRLLLLDPSDRTKALLDKATQAVWEMEDDLRRSHRDMVMATKGKAKR